MAWAFFFVGILFIVVAWKGKQDEFFALVQDDFTGKNNFFVWVLAIIILVALGNIKAIKPVSDAFLGLIIVVIIVGTYRGGRDLFSEFRAQLIEGTS